MSISRPSAQLLPAFVRLVEVGPRDGLQNEKTPVSVADRVRFIDMLSDSGLPVIEVGAFVSAKKVPQMADTAKVFAAIRKKPGVSYPVLVPNMHGMEDALKAGVREVAVFAAASETFSKKNIDCTIAESLERFRPVAAEALGRGMKVRGYISCVLGCPYEGAVSHEAVIRVTKALFGMGCYEVSLGDTIGVGRPEKTRALLQAMKAAGAPAEKLAGHFHDTGGRALDNIRAAMAEGITVFDSSASGLGGCPYAPGASGNVSTEAVLALMGALGIETDINASKVNAAGRFIRSLLK
jgi:hydroxymethylglutaryl-CoA lyase